MVFLLLQHEKDLKCTEKKPFLSIDMFVQYKENVSYCVQQIGQFQQVEHVANVDLFLCSYRIAVYRTARRTKYFVVTLPVRPIGSLQTDR